MITCNDPASKAMNGALNLTCPPLALPDEAVGKKPAVGTNTLERSPDQDVLVIQNKPKMTLAQGIATGIGQAAAFI